MSRATAFIEVDVPEGAHVGDNFAMSADVRVIMIREHQIEVTSMGGKRETLGGETEYEFQILNAELTRA